MANLNLTQLVNLEKASVLIVEDNSQSMDILIQILNGFGLRNAVKAAKASEAEELVTKGLFDLIIVEAMLAGKNGYEFVSWLRRSKVGPNAYAPVLMITSHTQQSKVEQARDCGANFIIGKPLTPAVMLDRILWVARESRPFIEADQYVGPDRRFRADGPPVGTTGRRKDDLGAEVGSAVTPNMTQSAIDAILQPKRATI